jgi:hypothetical protein
VSTQPINDERRITVWACDECDYWRQEKSTGVHQTTNLDDPHGRMARHPLREATFISEAALVAVRAERDDLREAIAGYLLNEYREGVPPNSFGAVLAAAVSSPGEETP